MLLRQPWPVAALVLTAPAFIATASRDTAVQVGRFPAIEAAGICPQRAAAKTPSGPAPDFLTGDDAAAADVPYAVSVTPDGSPATVNANTNGNTLNFSVTNTGDCPDTYSLSYSATGPITNVSLSKTSGTGPVTATFSVGGPGTGVLSVFADGAVGGASDQGSYNVTVTGPPVPAVSVTPDGATAPTRPANTGGYSQTFTITNTGNVQTTYTLSCSGSSNVTCTRINLTSVTLAAGAAATDTAYYSVGALGTGTLSLTASGGGVSDVGSYNVPVVVPTTPQSDDFASGNQVSDAGGTAGLNLDPGGAFDNIYTVHYFVTVSINAHSSQYGSSSLVVAIETNDGSGWVERGTYYYNCGYPSGPPPYAARTCTWSHEQQAITVTGLGLNDSLRLKAKSFTPPSNGAGGAFAFRGGDGGGANPETYNGVTYATTFSHSVAVRPELPERQGFAGATASQRFFVKNRGAVDATLALDYSCTGVTNCGVTPTGSLSNVAPGESRVVTLTYTLGAAGTTGTGMVKVFDTFDTNTLRDSASVALTAVGAPAPVVSVVDVNPGSTVERGACLTIAAGSAAAFECGDLRVIHPLPATRTLNKARVPTLLYNSAFADPYPTVAANVTLASGASVPDSIEAILTITGRGEVARARWVGGDWTPGATRRIALGYSAALDVTSVYQYTLEVATIYLGVSRNATSVTGELAVVNRKDSPFGAGWWLVGLEDKILGLADGRRVVIGGDGSVHTYSSVGVNLYAAPNLTNPDTLDARTADYVRIVPHGVRVHFGWTTGSAPGYRHTSTVNRLGHTTTFAYDACGRVITIALPAEGGGQVYTFTYASPSDCTTVLTSVTAPGGRTTTVWTSAQRVDSIRDPDNGVVKFAYESPSSRRISARTDRRGTVTSYSYDAAAKLLRAHVNLQSDSIRVGFRARDVLGLATASPKTATDTTNVYTSLFGARQFTTGSNYIAQETKFWLDRYGAPRRLINPLGQETIVRREDGEWQFLATELQVPTGFVTRGRYDRRGNIGATVAVNPLSTGQDAVTRYHWNPIWDFADSVATPTGVATTMAYDPVNGNRLWQQVGTDPTRRVTFRYGNTLRLLSSTVLPGTPPDSIEYNTMGNVSVVRTPKGFDTRYTPDAIGRDTMIQERIDTLSAIYQTTITKYDALDRDTLQIMIGPPLGAAAAETVFVRKYYNATGQADSLLRWSRSDVASIGTIRTKWTYDLAGRRLREIAPDGHQERWTYDPAGDVVTDSTRRGHILTMTYDGLNRLSTRALPGVSYASRTSNISWPQQAPYPAYQIGAETQTFTYDPLGQILTADNADAKVKRSYYPGGLLETDSLWIQTVGRDDWTRHGYGVRHTYDLDGHGTSLAIPQQLGATGLSASMGFAYDQQLGQLQSVTDLHGNPYVFTYNARAELDSLKYPAQYQEFFRYDADGRLAADSVQNRGGTTFPRLLTALVRASTYRYDAQVRLLRSGDPNGYQDTLSLGYSGLGHLAMSKLTEHGEQLYGTGWIGVRLATVESFTFDAMGNRTYGETRDTTRTNGQVSSTSYSNHISTYQAGTGRITLDAVFGGQTSFTYDAAGNTEFTSNQGSQFGSAQERASFYGADGTVRAVDWRWVANPTQVLTTAKYAFDEYRYDALGRRVWVWSKKDCTEEGNLNWWEAAECKTSLLRRTVWNGSQELAEIQMPGGTAANEVAVYENDVATVQLPNLQTQAAVVDRNQYFGRVLYTPGRGIDQPLAVTRINYEYQHDDYGSIIAYKVLAPITTMPFWNRNGDAAVGVFTTGVRRICNPPTTSPGDCVSVVWPYYWSAFDRNRSGVWDNWHGTVLENKRDKTNLSYSRNRYYDPQTGRFTQEDPVGLAGGLNLYGYAGGDPVNYRDPFGLWCPPCALAGVGAAEEAIPGVGQVVGTVTIAVAGVWALAWLADQALTSRAARRDVMRTQDIPTSQQPDDQRCDPESGDRQYKYEVPKPGGGTKTKVVTRSTQDRSHPDDPHWEAGDEKDPDEYGTQDNGFSRTHNEDQDTGKPKSKQCYNP